MRRIILLLLILTPFIASVAHGEGLNLDPDEIRGTASKKTVGVLQNRYFLKALRPELGLMVGTVLNESYTKTSLTGVRVGLFFNEWVGAEYQYYKTSVSDSEDREALNELKYRKVDDTTKIVSPDPEVNRIQGINDFSAIAAPFYGKLSFLDWAVIYTDLYGVLGMSRVSTDQGIKNALVWGGGLRLNWAQRWSTRLDIRDRIYSETRAGKETRKNSWSVDLGQSFLFF